MPLSSSSTIAEITAAYVDNASWQEDRSVAKAKAFITACRILLIKAPIRTKHGQSEIEFDRGQIRQEMETAQAFVSQANISGQGGSVREMDFGSFRD